MVNVLQMQKKKKDKKVSCPIKRQYWDDIEFDCPIKGRTSQRVLVTEYEAQPESNNSLVLTNQVLDFEDDF